MVEAMSIQAEDAMEVEDSPSPEQTLSRRKQKTKQKHLQNGPKKVKFNNEKEIRADLAREDVFITSLLKFLPRNQQSESLLGSDSTFAKVDTEAKLDKMKEKKPELFGSASRVHNYAELRQRIQNRLKEFSEGRGTGKRQKYSLEEKREVKKLKKKEEVIRRKELKQKKQNKPNKGVNVTSSDVKVTAENKPYIEKEGKMVFSKFDFNEKLEKTSKKPDYQGLLKKIEENKTRVAELKGKGEHTAVVEEAAWDKAMNLSEGKKVLDDPELIKKSIKETKRKRKKNIEAWDKRKADVQYKKDKKQEKRTANIKNRNNEKKERKLTRARKHGRLV